MAVVWAKSDGDWMTASLWAFWNESTQQIENYGQIPHADDVVYLNSHIVSVNLVNTSLISASEIRNGLNPHTNLSGGFVDLLNNTANILTLTIAADIIGFVNLSTQMIVRIGVDADNNRRAMNVIIIGDVVNAYISNDHRQANTSIINGNVSNSIWYSRFATSGANRSLTINGNWSHSLLSCANVGATTLTINGRVTDIVTGLIIGNAGKTCNINGYVKFAPTNNFIHNIGVNGIADMSELSADENLPMPFSSGYGLIKRTDLTIITPHLTDYPLPANVKKDISYAFNQMVGTYDINQYLPPETVVLKDFVYDNGDKIGSLENQNVIGCVTKEDVREGVELIGLQEVGTLVVPDAGDVREGVVFDNGSVGTLIVEGGGDRLRIANFGYYTDSQSDTYIVDINESFKQMFATAEESVLLELFPELDLDNIPDKYFDDLFVKYLKYRLIVEYYRGAGINSVFTPSELTTEVVNYQNVRCEYWLNLANIYLNAWDKKYPNSIKKQRILL